jgi:hypothetical protein
MIFINYEDELIELDVNYKTNIIELKKKIFEKTKIYPELQKIYLDTKEIDHIQDNYPIELKDESTLVLFKKEYFKLKCGICKKNESETFCRECDQIFCDKCLIYYHELINENNHTYNSSIKYIYCKKHFKKIIFFCLK